MSTQNAVNNTITGNAGTATALQNARTIGGVSFDGTANITVATATGGFTVSGGNLALGANSITMSGSIGVTGTRVTKGWFTDIESTNMPTVGGTAILTSLTAPQFTTIELGAASDTTLSRVSAGLIAVEGITLVDVSTAQGLTNKTLTTPVLTGLPTGTGVASAATASTLMSRDASANTTINNLIEGWATTATAAGTTTLVVGDKFQQYFTGSSTQTVKLPTTSIVAGQQYQIVNQSSGAITVQSSGANTIVILAGSTSAIFTALVATPTTAANWAYSYSADIVTSGKSLSVSNTLTLAGTDATTMTFPSTNATIARTDAANTFTGHQTIEGVTSTGATGTGKFVFDTSPTLVTPLLGTPTSGTLTNCTGLPEAGLTLADNTTANASTSAHGFLKKLDNTATHYMDGTGAWSTPPSSGADTSLSNLVTNNVINVVTISLTSANIKALSGTPITAIAAPGSGKIILVEEVLTSYTYGTVQYATGTGNVRVAWSGGTTSVMSADAMTSAHLKAAQNELEYSQTPAIADSSTDITARINTGIVVTISNATEYTAGDGTMKIFIKYRVVTL